MAAPTSASTSTIDTTTADTGHRCLLGGVVTVEQRIRPRSLHRPGEGAVRFLPAPRIHQRRPAGHKRQIEILGLVKESNRPLHRETPAPGHLAKSGWDQGEAAAAASWAYPENGEPSP